MELIRPLDKVTASSRWALKTASFDIDNTPSGSRLLGANSTVGSDTPKGILGGMVAKCSADWEAAEGIHTAYPIGLFAGQSEGNAFENTPAIASGVVPVYMNGGAFLLYFFETHAAESAYSTILSTYDIGDMLYCSKFGGLTTEAPGGMSPAGTNWVVAIAAKIPTATDLELGIKLLI